MGCLSRGWLYLALARAWWAGGDEVHAQAMLDQGMIIARRMGSTMLIRQVEAYRVRLKLAGGDLATASQWAAKRGFTLDDDLLYEREIEYRTWARVLTAQGRPDAAIRLLDRLMAAAEATGRGGHIVEMLVLQALAYQAAGNVTQAVHVLV